MHCCKKIRSELRTTEASRRPGDDPDVIIHYNSRFREYGIVIHDGTLAVLLINFCPWCGAKFPESLRDKWFRAVKKEGYSFEQIDKELIPKKYISDAWWKKLKSSTR